MKCGRASCNNRAKFQWTICGDNNCFRPICEQCDIELNEMVLKWMGFESVEPMMKRYWAFVIGSIEAT